MKLFFTILIATSVAITVHGNQEEPETGLRGSQHMTGETNKSSFVTNAFDFLRRQLDIGGCFNFETCGSGRSAPTNAHAWSGRTQDQHPPANCGSVYRSAHATATGLKCFGDNCSAIEIRCTDTIETNNRDRVQNVYWTNRFSEESSNNGRSFCATDHFMTGVSCDGRRCDNVSIECTQVFGRHHVEASCYWTESFSEENGGEITLPDGFFVRGIDCNNGFCDNKRLWACQESLDANRPNQFVTRSSNNPYTDITTDGLEPVSCGSRFTLGRVLVNGFQCNGDYCDDVQLRCHRHSESRITDTADIVMWTPMFSEENGGQVKCPDDHFLTGLRCDGSNCDNLSMECTRVVGRARNENSCQWTSPSLSEENGGNLYIGTNIYPNKFIAGIDCDGEFCDNKRFYVCEPNFSPSAYDYSQGFCPSSTSLFNLNGNPSKPLYMDNSNCALQLTTESRYQKATAFVPLAITNDFVFSAVIGYRIYGSSYTSADGMAFVMHQDPRKELAIGGGGGSLAIYGANRPNNRIKPALVVEMDTFKNNGHGDGHGDAVDVKLITDDGTITDFEEVNRVVRTPDGKTGNLWVNYDGQNLTISHVTDNTSSAGSPIINKETALDSVFDSTKPLYVGFTAATGDQADYHEVWSFYIDQSD